MSERPNILLITSDQQRGDCFGFEGRKVRTPHLDRMAAQGSRFSTCITPNVVRQPSRASILTGLLPRSHGVHDNGIDLDPARAESGFAARLGRAGYDTALIGKAHFATYHTFQPTGTPECLASSENFDAGWSGPYMGFQQVELMLIGHNWWTPMVPPAGQHYERWYHADGKGAALDAAYRNRLEPVGDAAQTWHSALPAAWHNSTWVGDRSVDYLRRRRADDPPFCLWASIPDPHHPFDAPDPWSRMHQPDAVDLPRQRHRDLERRPWWHRAALENEPQGPAEINEIRKNYSRIAPQSEAQLRQIIANYYGMIALIDHQVGRIMNCLAETGLDRSTLVIFTTDHGDWLGDHGLILKGPMHYEGLLRVGLILQGPGIPKDQVISDPVSTLDLAATFYDYAGGLAGELAGDCHGRSLRPLLEDKTASRDFALNEWDLLPGRAGVGLSLRTVRTGDAKLTVDMQSGAGELYDLAEDPDEMQNRFDDPAYAARQRLLLEMIESRPDDALGEASQPVGTA